MKAKIIILSVILLVVAGCKSSFEFSMLQPVGELNTKLPSLEPVVYISTLENAYSKGTSFSSGGAYSFGALGGVVTTVAASTTNYADKRVNDVIVLFERDIKNNVTSYIGDKKGKVTLKITNSSYVPKPKVGSYFAAWIGAMGLIYIPVYPKMVESENIGSTTALAGVITTVTALIVPFFIKPEATQFVEIEVEVTDLQNNVLGRYSGMGQWHYKSNMYKFPKDIQRIVNIEAFKNAMKQVKTKIDRDNQRLNEALNL